jgi:carbamoyltransferase
VYFLGINWEQNSTASLFYKDELLGCVSEERFSRVKNDERYPFNAINWLLESNNLTSGDIQKVIFVSNLWSPGYILTRHYTKFSVQDYISEQHKIWKPRFYENKNVSQLEIFKNRIDYEQYPGREFWEKVVVSLEGDSAHVSSQNSLHLGQEIRKNVVLNHLGINAKDVVFVDHSSSHAFYAYYSIPKEERINNKLVLTLDAFGDNVNYSARIFKNINGNVEEELICSGNDFIIGRLYRYITLILGLKPNEHEYKVMGLAPYCKPQYYEKLLEKFISIQDVSGINFKYLNKPQDMYFAIKDLLDGERFDTISGGLQAYTEYLITKWIRNLIQETGVDDITIAGGVAMNVKANMLISDNKHVKNLFIPACPDDSSQSMGAVYTYLHQTFKKKRNQINSPLNMYLGQQVNQDIVELKNIIKNYDNLDIKKLIDYDPIHVAELLKEGSILARCCGREEFGARALGNRSILADPRKIEIKKVINEKVKNRDFWMPFACSVNEEFSKEYFKLSSKVYSYSHMTLCAETTNIGIQNLKAAIHPYDYTCRPQIVLKETNPKYHELISYFGKITGVYALLNTSLNHHGKPIVSNFKDALDVFDKSDLDGIILGDYFLYK